MNEKYEFDRLRYAMNSVGFNEYTQSTIFAIISAVLLLGNITYIKRHGYHSDENAYIENEEVVDLVAQLLNIKTELLLQALTMKRHVMKTETVVTRYSVSEATNTRDAMAKCLYNALFHWIVLRINQALLKREVSGSKGYYIGILDIFGFEDVGAQWNSFEQLCINYANEHLQAYFNQHIFQFEQEEYFKEGISWTNIEYTDNTECVQLFQNKLWSFRTEGLTLNSKGNEVMKQIKAMSKPYGILRLIDEESNINNGTDESMLAKLNQFLKTNEYYETPQRKEPAFIVAHYAGKVKYQITGFREKNKDLMRQDVLNTLKTSKYALMRSLLGSDPVAVYRWSLMRTVFRAMQAFKQSGKKLQRSESAGHLRVTEEVLAVRRGSDSALSAFLRGDLHIDLPYFCDTSMFKTIVNQARRTPASKCEDKLSTLKSLQIPNNFDDNIILRQLRYTGMLETVRIRRAGYSVRIEYESFIQQYRILLRNDRDSTVDDVKEFINRHSSIESANVQYGLSKVFMRDAEKLILDDHLHKTIMQHIDTLQRWFRTTIARKRYLRLKQGVIRIQTLVVQAFVRGALARSKLRRQAYAALVIQTNWKRYQEQNRYHLIRDAVLALQAAYRGANARKRMEDILRGDQKPAFRVTRVHAVQLPTFDLNDPESLAAFATSDDELDSEDESSEDGLDEDVSESSVLGEDYHERYKTEIGGVSFIMKNRYSNLSDHPDPGFHRRQSLAPTGSTTKLKMLRRANSTESNNITRKDNRFKEIQVYIFIVTYLEGCKLCFHKECASFAKSIPCQPASPVRSPTRLYSPKRPWDIVKQRQSTSPLPSSAGGSWTFNLNKTKQQKQANLDHDKSKRDTIVDAIFKKSLREFHMELIGYEAVSSEERAVLKYRDLITTFEGLLTKVCKEEKVSFPTTLGVNAFRGFLNEFMQNQLKKKGSKQKSNIIKNVRKKRRKSDVTVIVQVYSVWGMFYYSL
uniref:Myosin motor domain-containing protein n=1 Tax=Heterorhabditis bacteriophora TaxID=37862 RepID=A0A1I7XGK0_HETBA